MYSTKRPSPPRPVGLRHSQTATSFAKIFDAACAILWHIQRCGMRSDATNGAGRHLPRFARLRRTVVVEPWLCHVVSRSKYFTTFPRRTSAILPMFFSMSDSSIFPSALAAAAASVLYPQSPLPPRSQIGRPPGSFAGLSRRASRPISVVAYVVVCVRRLVPSPGVLPSVCDFTTIAATLSPCFVRPRRRSCPRRRPCCFLLMLVLFPSVTCSSRPGRFSCRRTRSH